MRFARHFSVIPLSLLALLALASVLGASSTLPSINVATSNGFCRDGVWPGTRWPDGKRPGGLKIWGSFCNQGNDDVGHAESEEFLAPGVLNIYLAGYVGLPDRRLLLKNVQSGEEKELTPPSTPGDEWHFNILPLPPEWIGQRVQLIAEDRATGLQGWLGFSLPIVPVSSLSSTAIDTNTPPVGYCPGGAFDTTKWPKGERPKGLSTWGSYCRSGDKDTGWAATQPFIANSSINIYLAGYPDTPGLALAAENLETAQQLPLHIPKAPGEKWELHHFLLPLEWKGQLVRIISRDRATGLDGWAAFSEPLPATAADVAAGLAKKFGLIFFVAIALLLPSVAASMLAARRGVENLLYLTATALLTLGVTFGIFFHSRFWSPDYGFINGCAGWLAVAAILIYFAIAHSRTWPNGKPGSRGPIRRWRILALAWGLTALAVLPAVFHWGAPSPFAYPDRYLEIAFAYLVASVLCYSIYRAESPRLTQSQAIILVFFILLLTSVINNLHSFNVDHATNYFAEPNLAWQTDLQNSVIRLDPRSLPHSYRFLPNSIVRWLELGHIDYDSARDFYRLIFGLLLFYVIYKYARLYCNYAGAIIAMLLVTAIYPISFEYYAGQLADPLSHLSFVLAFIFLETGEFALLLTTLVIGSLAKETVLAMAVYYLLFCRKERNYPLKAAGLCFAIVAIYFGVRLFVLHGTMSYAQASGVPLEHIWENWQRYDWPVPSLLTAGALLPLLVLGWKQTALSLKRQIIFLFPVLVITNLVFSWLSETRNYMPLVFVMAVAAGGYLSRQFADTPPRKAAQPYPETAVESTIS